MNVEIARRGAGRKYPLRGIKKTAIGILRLLKQERVEVSLVLVGNREIRKLNALFRKKDYPTDVLSFPAAKNLPGRLRPLGDVVISVDKARAQAKERGRPLREEVITLLIHGIVHLLGYDHERSAREARVMRRLESRIFRSLCGGERLKV